MDSGLLIIIIILFFFALVIQEVKDRPLPIVFAAFSGGPKACMYKVLKVNVAKFWYSIYLVVVLWSWCPFFSLVRFSKIHLCACSTSGGWVLGISTSTMWRKFICCSFFFFSPDNRGTVWSTRKSGILSSVIYFPKFFIFSLFYL